MSEDVIVEELTEEEKETNEALSTPCILCGLPPGEERDGGKSRIRCRNVHITCLMQYDAVEPKAWVLANTPYTEAGSTLPEEGQKVSVVMTSAEEVLYGCIYEGGKWMREGEQLEGEIARWKAE